MKLMELLEDLVVEKWSMKYKKTIDCSNPKGFSQKAHCAARDFHFQKKFLIFL